MSPEDQARFRQQIHDLVATISDPASFAEAVRFHQELADQLAQQAQQMTNQDKPKSHRYSWADIGRAFGVTRQSVTERFGRK